MDQASRRRGRPLPGARNIKPIIYSLEEALAVENLYRPDLLVIQHDILPGEVTLESRDGVVHLLKFLNVWFDAPDYIFFYAVTYLDLFISLVKVREKYLQCAAFACFYVACRRERMNVTLKTLVTVSKCHFSTHDIIRMATIIREKLKLPIINSKIATVGDILKICLKFLGKPNSVFKDTLDEKKLSSKLQVLMADTNCAFSRPSVLVFTLLKLEIDKELSLHINPTGPLGGFINMITIMKELKLRCRIKSYELVKCTNHTSRVLKQYNSNGPCLNNIFLRWKAAPRSYNKLKSTTSSLDIIAEEATTSSNQQQKSGSTLNISCT